MHVNNVSSNDEYKKQIRYLKRYNTLSLIVTLCFGILLFLFLVYLFTNQFSSFWAYYVLGILAALCAIIMNFLLSLKPFLALTTPLNDECDPHKFIALNQAINRRPHPLPLVYSLGYFFLGHFESSAMYAEQVSKSNGPFFLRYKWSILIYKASSEYMQGDFSTARHTIRKFEDFFHNSTPKVQEKNKNIHLFLLLLQAIMDLDIEKINEYRNVYQHSIRSFPKLTAAWLTYLLGIAAYYVNDYETAFQYFSSLMQGYEKTFLAQAASEYIEKIKPLLFVAETR